MLIQVSIKTQTKMPYALKHGVNLSRRACRWTLFQAYVLLIIFENVVPQSTDVPPQPPPISPVYDTTAGNMEGTYPGLLFGPMGPKDRESPTKRVPELRSGGSSLNQAPESAPIFTDSATLGVGDTLVKENVSQKKIKRYPVAAVEFHRVETPFIIGLWIFCASLAKIGKLIFIFSIIIRTHT